MSEVKAGANDPFDGMPISKVLSYIGLQAVFFTAIALALWRMAGRSEWKFVTFSFGETGNGLLLAIALIALSAGLAKTFPRYAEWLIRSQARNYSFLKNRISIGAIIFISLCAGIGEEALFRGGLQTLLGDFLPLPLALALASALFALIHFAQPLNSALIFIIGCLFGVVYWQTESLLTVMVAHAVYDVYALWALQKAMHELGLFDEEPSSPASRPLPPGEENETLGANTDTTGETL